jgi:hypothetical protein
LWHFVNPLLVLNAQTSGQFFISIRLTTQFGITLEINLLLFSCVWNKGVGFYYFWGFIVAGLELRALRKDFWQIKDVYHGGHGGAALH